MWPIDAIKRVKANHTRSQLLGHHWLAFHMLLESMCSSEHVQHQRLDMKAWRFDISIPFLFTLVNPIEESWWRPHRFLQTDFCSGPRSESQTCKEPPHKCELYKIPDVDQLSLDVCIMVF